MNDSSDPIPRFDAHHTDRFTSKFWILPANQIVALTTLHYDYFRDAEVAQRYGVDYADETSTRIGALRAGFVRVNYELNGGKLTLETIRWDKALQKLTTDLVLANAEAIDLVHIHRLDPAGQLVELGSLSLQTRRRYHLPIDERAISGWNRLKEVRLQKL